LDAGSHYSLSNPLPSPLLNERWLTAAATSGVMNGPVTFSATYHNQYQVSANFALVGGGSPSAPVLTYAALGGPASLPLTASAQSFWADGGSQYSTPQTLASSSSTERWFDSAPQGTVQAASGLTFTYYHEFFLGISGAGLTS